jgi:putative DNA primase/helicase
MTAKFKMVDLPSEQSDQAASGPELIVRCAADVKPEPVEWLWPGRIALGKLTLIAGEAGLGKSQLSIAMAASVTTGGAWPCREGRAPQGSVVILSAEDGAADTVVPRLMAAGADRERVHLVSAVRSEDGTGRRAFNLQADLDLLERLISEIGDVKLIVIDPISSYLGPKVDSHVNAAVRAVLEPVSEMAARLRIAIVAITHPPKGTGTTAINRFIGSIAFVAAARAAFMVTRDTEDEMRRLFLPVKNNLAPLGKGLAFRPEQRLVADGIVGSSVAWEAEPVTITADQALQATDAQSTGKGSAGAEAEEFLRNALATGPVAMKDIQAEAKEAGLSWATVRRAKDRLGVEAERKSHGRDGGGRWTWAMPIPARRSSHLQDAHPSEVSTLQESEHLAALDQARAPVGGDFKEAWDAYCPGQNTLLPQSGTSETCKRASADEMGIGARRARPFLIPNSRRCDHCGQLGTAADLLHGWDWPGRPDGIRLHSRCEASWKEKENR